MLEACRQSLEQYAAEANEMAAGVGKQVSTDARLVRTRGVDMDRIGSPVNTVVAEEDGASFESNDAQLLDISNTVQP